jgi:hypothetical protein
VERDQREDKLWFHKRVQVLSCNPNLWTNLSRWWAENNKCNIKDSIFNNKAYLNSKWYQENNNNKEAWHNHKSCKAHHSSFRQIHFFLHPHNNFLLLNHFNKEFLHKEVNSKCINRYHHNKMSTLEDRYHSMGIIKEFSKQEFNLLIKCLLEHLISSKFLPSNSRSTSSFPNRYSHNHNNILLHTIWCLSSHLILTYHLTSIRHQTFNTQLLICTSFLRVISLIKLFNHMLIWTK